MVQLGWKKIRFWFTLLTNQGRLRIVLVHVVRNGAQVIEKFAVHGPALVFLPDLGADQHLSRLGDRLPQRERRLAIVDDVAKPFVPGSAFVGGGRGRRKPAFVDAATFGAVGIKVLRGQFEPPAGHQERTRHPGWRSGKMPPALARACLRRCGLVLSIAAALGLVCTGFCLRVFFAMPFSPCGLEGNFFGIIYQSPSEDWPLENREYGFSNKKHAKPWESSRIFRSKRTISFTIMSYT